ncbi:MAG: DUF211 domain-containing protein [Candidatus Micrarchaeota archaeon]
MIKLKSVTLEVMKPSELQTVDLLKALEKISQAKRVEIRLTDFEKSTETLLVTVEGNDVSYEKVAHVISDYGGVIQNVQRMLGER